MTTRPATTAELRGHAALLGRLHAAGLATPLQAGTLIALALRTAPANMTTIAADMGCTAPGITGVADMLEDRGLARRSYLPGDRRQIMLEITAAGRALLAGDSTNP